VSDFEKLVHDTDFSGNITPMSSKKNGSNRM